MVTPAEEAAYPGRLWQAGKNSAQYVALLCTVLSDTRRQDGET